MIARILKAVQKTEPKPKPALSLIMPIVAVAADADTENRWAKVKRNNPVFRRISGRRDILIVLRYLFVVIGIINFAVGISSRDDANIAICGSFLILAVILWLVSIILLGQMEQLRLLTHDGGNA